MSEDQVDIGYSQKHSTTPFLYKQSIFDPRPKKPFLKNRPKKLFSNCLIECLLTSIA